MRLILELNLLLLLASACAAQMAGGSVAAEIRNVNVTRSGDSVKIEVTLSTAVTPTVITATGPDRLVLNLPNTTANARQQHIAVNQNGVKRIRIGLNSADPLITRLVVDVDTARQYELATAGNIVTLTVLPGTGAVASHHAGGAVPAENAPLITKLWPLHRQEKPSVEAETTAPVSPPPAAKVSPPRAEIKPKPVLRTGFQIKYVAEGAAYLDGGRRSGLAEGMKLWVRDNALSSADSTPQQQSASVAELQVVSVTETSAVTEIHAPKRDLVPGDWAYLSAEDSAERSLSSSKAPALALTPEPVRRAQLAPTPILPEDTRIRARVAVDYSGVRSDGSTLGSSGTFGLSFHTDMTRIAGTYWNLQGDWRGRLTNNSQADEQTIQDYLDKTYTIQLYYDNPDSKWVAGFGRLYLPWAVSIDTIDGGYAGRKVAKGVTTGVFFGSTPNPTSWNYTPDQQIGGAFVNFEGGSYDDFHYTSTAGFAMDMVKWQLDRPYVFFENGISYKNFISVYHSFIVDSPQGVTTDGIKPGTGIARSYLTLHIQPHKRISFDIYHNYFRDTPTAATALIGTGMVDKLLYQGINAGVHVEPIRHFTVYTTIGQSDKTGDMHRSLNQMYGLTWTDILRTGIRADVHYSKFDSDFARGEYRIVSLSRYLGDRLMWTVQAGTQNLNSSFTVNNSSYFIDTSFDTNLGRHSYVQSGYTISRGAQLNYEQWYISLGYRFDVKGPVK